MLNVYAPINGLGYGVHSYNFLKALDGLGVEIAIHTPSGHVEFSDEYVEKWLENQKRFNAKDVGLMIFHEWYLNKFCGKPRIGFPVFETGVLDIHKGYLESVDYLLQPSMYGKNYLESMGLNNVHIVHEGFDSNIFNLDRYSLGYKEELLEKHGIVFSHVGKLEARKGTLDVIRVFSEVLVDAKIRCNLVLHVLNIFLPNWLDILKAELLSRDFSLQKETEEVATFIKKNLRITILKVRVKSIYEIYNASHFGLYLSKAEGWNLPLIESIASGVPCITTNWTGQSEYLKGYPEELIVGKGKEVAAKDDIWFFGNKGNWVEPDLVSVKKILQNIVKEPLKYLALSNRCRECVQSFTWKNAGREFIELMGELNVKL